MNRTFQYRQQNDRRASVIELIDAEMKMRALAGDDFDVTVSEPKRTLPENALLHALIAELSKKLAWAGQKRDDEVWKRLLVSAWCRANGKAIEILPALDGHGIELIPVRTSNLGKKACADLIEFVYAFGADQGITWDEHTYTQP